MSHNIRVWFVVAAGLAGACSAAATAQDDDEAFVVIQAGRVITVSGETFAPGTIVIVDGRVRLVGGHGLEYPPSARVIHAPRETVMPGMVHPRSRFALTAYKRAGVHGDADAGDEVYPALIPWDELLEAGFTAVCFYPEGTGVTGMARVIRTGGPDDARTLKDPSYLRVTMTSAGRDKKVLRGALAKAKSEIEKVEKARKEWEKKHKAKTQAGAGAGKGKPAPNTPGGKPRPEPAKKPTTIHALAPAAPTGDTPPPKPTPKPAPDKDKNKDQPKPGTTEPDVFKPPAIDPAHQPLVDLIQHEQAADALFELSRASDLRHLDDVLKPYEDIAAQYALSIRFTMDFDRIVEDLGDRDARVMLRPGVFYLAYTVTRYNLADRLARAGCEVSFVPWADSVTELGRVRERVADLVRAGLDRGAALKGLTLFPARAVGLGDRLGSIEKDKDADLVFFDGDPLAPGTRTTRVMILGEVVWESAER